MIHLGRRSKDKIGLISRETDTSWVSCIHINAGLTEAYSLNFEILHIKLYNISSEQIVSKIINSDITCLVFLDHQVRPIEILKDQRLRDHIKTKKIRTVFHTYGCFIDRMDEYHEVIGLLPDCDIHFVAASPKQKKVIEKVLLNNIAVHLVPFPIKEQFFSNEIRNEMRKKMGIPDDVQLFLYTGRISTFKNVELVMKMLHKIRTKNPKIHFFYIGLFDNFENYKANDRFSNSSTINAKMLRLVDPKSEWCFYRPFVSSQELSLYYQIADAFISLSVTRGEDFGMSVLEASSFGLPCYLTDWAGYSGFNDLPAVTLAKVKMGDKDISIDLGGIEDKISSFVTLSDDEKKNKRDKTYADFSVEKTATRLSELLSSPNSNPLGIKKEFIIRRNILRRVDTFDFFEELKDLYEIYAS